jgi:DNA repair exonuclease SbcCD ATPase subunit
LEIKLKGTMFDVDYEEDSGGGKQWVAIGIRFALYNLLRERGLMQDIDFWIMDEIFAPLSDVGRQSMLSFLDGLCSSYGINQLFLITHSDISAILPPAIIVERTEATQQSRILS